MARLQEHPGGDHCEEEEDDGEEEGDWYISWNHWVDCNGIKDS